jgi:hypothetical protein
VLLTAVKAANIPVVATKVPVLEVKLTDVNNSDQLAVVAPTEVFVEVAVSKITEEVTKFPKESVLETAVNVTVTPAGAGRVSKGALAIAEKPNIV